MHEVIFIPFVHYRGSIECIAGAFQFEKNQISVMLISVCL